jgi:hypothetical protein
MLFKSFGSVIVAITLSVGSAAIAQTSSQKLAFHMQVGADHEGNPIVLDASSVQGTQYTILQKQGDGLTKTTFRASCTEGRLFTEKSSVYNATGELISEQPTQQEISLQPGTPEANSMDIVCQAANHSASR